MIGVLDTSVLLRDLFGEPGARLHERAGAALRSLAVVELDEAIATHDEQLARAARASGLAVVGV